MEWLTLALALATVALAWHTRNLAKEAKATRHQDAMPVLRLDANPLTETRDRWSWRLRNVGAGPATEIACQRRDSGLVTHTDFAQHARNIIGAGEEWDHELQDAPDFRDAARLQVTFFYSDIYGNRFETDVDAHRNTFRVVSAPYKAERKKKG